LLKASTIRLKNPKKRRLRLLLTGLRFLTGFLLGGILIFLAAGLGLGPDAEFVTSLRIEERAGVLTSALLPLSLLLLLPESLYLAKESNLLWPYSTVYFVFL